MDLFLKIRNCLNFNGTSKLNDLKLKKEDRIEALQKRYQIPFDQVVYETPIESRIFIESGLEFVRQKMFLDAADHFTKAILHEPQSYEGYFYRGLSRLNIGDIEGCLVDLTKATVIKPDYGLAYANLADIYSNHHKLERAVKNFDLAVRYGMDDFLTYYKRGLAYRKLQKYTEAIEDYTISIELNPSFAEAYLARGMVFYLIKNKEAEISDYNKAIEIDSSSAMAYHNRGVFKLELKDFDNAKQDFEKAAQLGCEDSIRLLKNWDHTLRMKFDWTFRILVSIFRWFDSVLPAKKKH